MPTLTARDPGPVLVIPAGVNGYRFVGVEIRPEPGQFLTNLVMIGGGSRDLAPRPTSSSIAAICTAIRKRHAARRRAERRGHGRHQFVPVGLQGSRQRRAGDCGWDGPGPYAISNNHLEAAGENLLLGRRRSHDGGSRAVRHRDPAQPFREAALVEGRRSHVRGHGLDRE